MKKYKNIVVFCLFPIIIICLLLVNGKLAEKKYEVKDEAVLKQYDAIISSEINSIKGKPNEIIHVKITVKNLGTMTWIPQQKNDISISYHIINSEDKMILNDGLRTNLSKSVKSGEEVSFDMLIEAPKEEGNYKIELDMVHEGVTWFSEKGSRTLMLKLEVSK